MLVEARDRDIARLVDVPFVRDVDRLGPPRFEQGVAAVAVPRIDRPARLAVDRRTARPGAGVAERGDERSAHFIHARTRQHLRRGQAQAMPATQIQDQVQAGQPVGIAGRLRHRRHHARGDRRVDREAIGLLLLVDHLQPDVAAQRPGFQLQLGAGGEDVFLDPPGLVEGVGVHIDGLVVVDRQRLLQVDRQHIAHAGKAQRGRIEQILRTHQRLRAAVLQEQVVFGHGLGLGAARVVAAQLDAAEEAFAQVALQPQIDGPDLFDDLRVLGRAIMAPAAPRGAVAQRDLAGVGIVQPFVKPGEAAAAGQGIGEVPRDGIERAVGVLGRGGRAGAIALIGFGNALVPLVAGIGQVGDQRGRFAQRQLVVPAHREQLVVAGVVIVAQLRRDAVGGAGNANAGAADGGGADIGESLAIGPDVGEPLRTAHHLALLEARVVEIERGVDRFARFEFQNADQRVALVLARVGEHFLPGDERGCARARRADVAIDPAAERFVVIQLGVAGLGRAVEVGIAQRPAKRASLVLADPAGAAAPAPVAHVVVQLAAGVEFAAQVERDGGLAIFQRAHGAQVGRTSQTHAGDAGVRRLVDHDAAQQFRRILVKLDRAVVARTGLLAAIEQRGGEVGREPAQRDHLRAAVDTLGGEAGQARDRFRDRLVGQLADVFGRNGFDDAVGVALGVDRVGDGEADAGDQDAAILVRHFGRVGAWRILRQSLRRECRQSERGSRGQPETIRARQPDASVTRINPQCHSIPSMKRGFPGCSLVSPEPWWLEQLEALPISCRKRCRASIGSASNAIIAEPFRWNRAAPDGAGRSRAAAARPDRAGCRRPVGPAVRPRARPSCAAAGGSW